MSWTFGEQQREITQAHTMLCTHDSYREDFLPHESRILVFLHRLVLLGDGRGNLLVFAPPLDLVQDLVPPVHPLQANHRAISQEWMPYACVVLTRTLFRPSRWETSNVMHPSISFLRGRVEVRVRGERKVIGKEGKRKERGRREMRGERRGGERGRGGREGGEIATKK